MRWGIIAAGIIAAAIVLIGRGVGKQFGFDKEALIQLFRHLSDRLGFWAIPIYVLVHTLTLALCLPSAIFFEAGASLLFGFFPAVLCVFSAKVLGASLSFWIGRLIFVSSSSAREWVQNNKHFHMLSSGVEQDGWRFVLLARFSPVPSYVINYALAATKNTSLGSLAGAAVASASGSQKSKLGSYIFPLIGVMSSVLISLRIKKYCKNISVESSAMESIANSKNAADSSQPQISSQKNHSIKKRR